MKKRLILMNFIYLMLMSSSFRYIDSKLNSSQIKHDIDVSISKLVSQGIIVIEPKLEIRQVFKLMNLVNYTEIIKYLLDQGLDVNAKFFVTDIHWLNLLMIACMMNDPKLCEILIEYGASLNIKNEEGKTALLVATLYGNHNLVELLINKGARFDEQDAEGNIALLFAVIKNKIEVIKILIKNGLDVKNETRTFFNAILLKNIETIGLLINNGLDVNALNKDGIHALHVAMSLLDNESPKYLEQNQLLKNAPDAFRKLNVEVEEIVKLLLKNGANPNLMVKIDFVFPLLSIAVDSSNIEIIKLLLNYGADVNLTSSFLTNSLFYASEKKIAELLVENCLDINHQAVNGDTALHWAIRFEREEVVEVLITKGADVSIRNIFGFSVLDLAILNGNQRIIDLLIKNGAR